jgi:4-amino-4-deoxy-L-arabinose transferase-like glycosyltransferase
MRLASGLFLLTALLKVPTLGTPAYWDEMAWLGQAHELWRHDLWWALPGLHPAAAFWGHPPGLHLLGAALWKLTGPSLTSAHLLIALFAGLGVASTHLLGRELGDARSGTWAALLLLATPLYFAQAGFFLADVPITALGVTTLWLLLRGRTAAYLACATAMLLIKETSIALLAAFLLYLLLRDGPRSAAVWRRTALLATPLLVIGAFFVAQKIATGHFFFIYEFEIELFYLTPATAWNQFRFVTEWIFREQQRWLITALIAVAVSTRGRFWKRPELHLLLVVATVFGYAFAILLLLPRYLLPVLPFLYLAGLQALRSLVPSSRLRDVLAAGLVVAVVAAHASPRFFGSGETDLAYVTVARLNREACAEIEQRFPAATVLAAFPQVRQLAVPLLGYVEASRRAVSFEANPEASADLILTSAPWAGPRLALRERAGQEGWRLLRRWSDGGEGANEIAVELYARPAP